MRLILNVSLTMFLFIYGIIYGYSNYWLLIGLFFGSVGLCGWHELVHRFNLYNISIVWKQHKLHHINYNNAKDCEFTLRRKYPLPIYASYKTLLYFKYFTKWSIFDYLILLLGIIQPTFGLACLFAIFIAENISFLQHTYNGIPIDFTNKFDNFIGCDFGAHASHHGTKTKYKISTLFWWGLFCAYLWLIFVISFYPLLKLSHRKANVPGVYKYSLMQNIANYIALNGRSIYPLLWRASSVFDKPIILIQYLSIIFGYKVIPSHDISEARNIYKQGVFVDPNALIILYKGKCIEGHHRFAAKNYEYFNNIKTLNN